MDEMMNGMMDGMMNGNMMDWRAGGSGGWLGGVSMFLMGIVPLLLIGLVVWLVVEGIRRNDAARPSSSSVLPPYAGTAAGSDRTPQTILNERYAAGEIDREEYLQRRADLAK